MNIMEQIPLTTELIQSRILLFDRRCDFIKDLYECLQHDGYTVRLVFDSAAILASSRSWTPDLIVIGSEDAFPGLNDVCRHLQRISDVPLLVLSSEARESILVSALEAGAADYVKLPRSLSEVSARIRAQLRRRLTCSLSGPRAA